MSEPIGSLPEIHMRCCPTPRPSLVRTPDLTVWALTCATCGEELAYVNAEDTLP